VPLSLMVYDTLTGNLPAEPVKDLTHRTGRWAVTLLTLCLAVTPLRRLSGWNGVISYRRMLGLWAFAYAVVHFLIYLVADQFFAWAEIVEDVAKRPFITLGFTAFVLLWPLALTSTTGSIRRLGRRWTLLHALIYPAALAAIVHFIWGQKADLLVPTRYAVILAVLLTIRLVPRETMARVAAAMGRLAPLRALRPPPQITPSR
jgi:sulfoxide reductase heme-binding subunit YedZ